MIQINDQHFCRYATANPKMSKSSIYAFSTARTAISEMSFKELWQKHDVETAAFLVDSAKHLQAALQRSELRFQIEHHGNQNSIQHVF